MSKQRKKKPGPSTGGPPEKKAPRRLSDEELREEFEAGDPIMGELWIATRRLDVIDMACGDEVPESIKEDEIGELEQLTPGQLFTWTMTQILKGLDQLRELRQQICIAEFRAMEAEEKAAASPDVAPVTSTEVQ